MRISNFSPSHLHSSPRLRLGLLSRGEGLILLIHTSKPCYITLVGNFDLPVSNGICICYNTPARDL